MIPKSTTDAPSIFDIPVMPWVLVALMMATGVFGAFWLLQP